MARRSAPRPLPLRDGVDPTRVVLRPHDADRPIRDRLCAVPALAGITAEAIEAAAQAGDIVDARGDRVAVSQVGPPVLTLWLYRDLPDESPAPTDLPVLYTDDNLLVVDKPHFLATMPRGRHVVNTALVQLRRSTGNADLSPIHRLDRLTAGVLMLSVRPQVRAAYQELFAARQVAKEYRALAPVAETVQLPAQVSNRIEKDSGDLRARVVAGEPNAHSRIELLDAARGEYRLMPTTGRTHQLRVHMSGLGIPIIDDPLYPQVRETLAELPDRGDFSRPLRLLAYSVRFTDPITGVEREFRSQRTLSAGHNRVP